MTPLDEYLRGHDHAKVTFEYSRDFYVSCLCEIELPPDSPEERKQRSGYGKDAESALAAALRD